MKTLLLLPLSLLIAGSVYAQCPTGTAYPSALDTSATLSTAANNLSTTLITAQQVTDTVLVVASTTGWSGNMMATVDSGASVEYEFVTSVTGANILNVSRGCEGSTATTHALGIAVSQNATAGPGHNFLSSAIEAIEAALGTNLSNVQVPNPLPQNKGGTGTNSPLTGPVIGNGASAMTAVSCSAGQFPRAKNAGGTVTFDCETLPTATVTSTDYIFTALSCNSSLTCAPGGSSGGALIIGNNSLTLSPVPIGVNGSDSNHYLYVSGGTGTAEACLISGGSGTSGQASGLIILNCANTHSGAFTIQSNSSGIQEAFNQGLAVSVPPGSYNIYGTIAPPANSTLRCGGMFGNSQTSQTNLVEQFNGVPLINDTVHNFLTDGCYLVYTGTATAGSVGILLSNNAYFAEIRNTNIYGFYYGIENNDSTGIGQANLFHVTTQNSQSHGIFGNGYSWQGYFDTVLSEFNKGDGAHITGSGQGPFFVNYQSFNNGGWGGYFSGANVDFSGGNNSFNNDYSGELYIKCAGITCQVGDVMAYGAGNTSSFGVNATAIGIEVDSGGNLPVIMTNTSIMYSEGNGLLVNGPPSSGIQQSVIAHGLYGIFNGQSATAGNTYDVLANYGVLIDGGYFNDPVKLTGATHSQFTNNEISLSVNSPALYITGNSLDVVVANNAILNGGASGTGFQCDSGSTLAPGWNLIHGNTTQTNNCSLGASATLTAPPLANIATETGGSANNALVATLPGASVQLGLCIGIKLAHTLQAGANTLNLNGAGVANIKSHFNVSNNIATAYAVNSMFAACYDGAAWQDRSQ